MKLAGDDRRRSGRNPFIIESWLIAEGDKARRIEVISVNLSKHGIGFEVPVSLQLDQIFTIEIGFGQQKLISEVRIVNCRQIENGFFRIGADFN